MHLSFFLIQSNKYTFSQSAFVCDKLPKYKSLSGNSSLNNRSTRKRLPNPTPDGHGTRTNADPDNQRRPDLCDGTTHRMQREHKRVGRRTSPQAHTTSVGCMLCLSQCLFWLTGSRADGDNSPRPSEKDRKGKEASVCEIGQSGECAKGEG